jgi:TRAP-type uncharacterized transport system substrate-binding protein
MAAFSFNRVRWYAREWIAAFLCLVALAVVVTVYFSESRPGQFALSISAGSSEGLRHQVAERLAIEGTGHGLEMRLEPTTGSREALDRVDARKLDVALVQGGLDPAFHPHVRQVAALHIEPLHLLVKPALYERVSNNLVALKDKAVNLGPTGSGTHDLARDVLKFAGLTPKRGDGSGDYTIASLSYGELLAETSAGRLPDAIFTVSGLPSPVVRALVVRHHYQLVPLPFGEAFALDAFNQDKSPAEAAELDAKSDVAKVRIYPCQIPPFTYGIEPPMPPREIATFGPRLLLVANKNVPSRAVQQILQTIFSPPFAQISKPPLDASLLDISPEYPLHAGTARFQELNKPLMAGDVIDLLEKGTSLAGGVVGAVFFLWQWARQHFRRKRELGFESYMLKVTEIEEQTLSLEMEAKLEIKELLRLLRELGRLKSEALARFAEGKLEGGQLITGFISHVNDARNYLNRLILHERENLEDQAQKERRTAESVWSEAMNEVRAESAPVEAESTHPVSSTEPSPSIALRPT